MSKALFDALLKEVDSRIAKALNKWRPDLRKTTGAIPGAQLPTTGNTGSGYTPVDHQSDHQSGGGDALSGNLDAVARVGVRKNSTGSTFSRRRVNFIEGTGVGLTVADDSSNEEVDVTISSTGTGTLTIEEADGSPTNTATKLKFPNGTLVYAGTEATYTPTSTGTTAEYLTTASDGALSAEVVIPGLAGSSDRAGIGGGGSITEEWDSATTGLTWTPSTPATVDSDTTIPSHLYILSTDNTVRYGTRTFAPGAAVAFDVRCKVADLAANSASGTVYIGLHIQNSGNTASAALLIKAASGIYNLETYTANPGYTIGASRTTNGIAPYVRISRDGSNNVSWWFSYTGLVWTLIYSASFTFTPALAGFYVQGGAGMNAEAAVDWLRSDV